MMRRTLILALLALAGCSSTPDHYVASKKSQIFHRPTCGDAAHIEKAHLVTFATRDEAIKAGHRPCEVCKP
ncbi:unnamed protein product [Phaeothamnion confervicola]